MCSIRRGQTFSWICPTSDSAARHLRCELLCKQFSPQTYNSPLFIKMNNFDVSPNFWILMLALFNDQLSGMKCYSQQRPTIHEGDNGWESPLDKFIVNIANFVSNDITYMATSAFDIERKLLVYNRHSKQCKTLMAPILSLSLSLSSSLQRYISNAYWYLDRYIALPTNYAFLHELFLLGNFLLSLSCLCVCFC